MCTDVEADCFGRNRMRLILGERRKEEKIKVGGDLGKCTKPETFHLPQFISLYQEQLQGMTEIQ
jgi:hypothetical protein